MRVSGWEVQRNGGAIRCSLTLRWEDCERADTVAWIEWPEEQAEVLTADADSALLAAFPLAMWQGERRLQLEGDLCPRLADNARTAMALLAGWNPGLRPLALEVTERAPERPAAPHEARDAALCFSGGVDTLAALRLNRRHVPAGHPARYRQGLFAFGLNSYDLAADGPRPERWRAYEAQGARLARLAEACDLTLVRVASNLRSLYPSFEAWGAVAHGSSLAAFGHAIRRRLRSLAIANSGLGVGPEIVPHPLLDGFYASHDLDVHSVHATLPRLEKVREVAQWPEGLAALRVCYLIDLPAEGQVNCGRCEKCVRTMVQLLAVGSGALARAPFPVHDVTPAELERISFDGLMARIFFTEVMPALAAQGRDDLVTAIRRGLERPRGATSGGNWRRWWRRRGS